MGQSASTPAIAETVAVVSYKLKVCFEVSISCDDQSSIESKINLNFIRNPLINYFLYLYTLLLKLTLNYLLFL